MSMLLAIIVARAVAAYDMAVLSLSLSYFVEAGGGGRGAE
jgi:hypothetical protein